MYREHVLIFEPLAGGHREEFLRHLLDFIGRADGNQRHYTFVVNAVPSGFSELPNVSFREIRLPDKTALAKSHGPMGGFVFWRILRGYLKELAPDRLLIMDLTWLELPLCFARPSCPFSGILFVQYPELLLHSRSGFRERMKLRWKEMKTRRFLQVSRPDKVFLLNGDHSCDYLNSRFNTSCYTPLPDPVSDISAEPGVDIRKEYDIDTNHTLFLFFGSMSARKGVEPLVEALGSLPEAPARKSTFLLCGVPEPDYAERYHQLLEDLKRKRSNVHFCVEESFISDNRMRAMFEQADWILMPYTRPEYSSGILAHAASASTPVIAPLGGLVGRQVRRHGLGRAIPLEELSHAIAAAVNEEHEFDESARVAFVKAGSPDRFASVLLER